MESSQRVFKELSIKSLHQGSDHFHCEKPKKTFAKTFQQINKVYF